MKKIKLKYDQANFDRCQQFLKVFSQHRLNTPYKQIHKFVGRADRDSIRSSFHFIPLQEALKQLTPKITQDLFIASTPLLVSNMSLIYNSLNFYSNAWMDHCSRLILKWLATKDFLPTETIYQVYRAYIELNDEKNLYFLDCLREEFKKRIASSIKELFLKKDFQLSTFSRQFEVVHRNIRAIVLDKYSSNKMLEQLIGEIAEIFQTVKQRNPFVIDEHYFYNNCAASYEICKIRKINFPQGIYEETLRKIYELRVESKLHKIHEVQKRRSDFEKIVKSQSVFEMRFKKKLQINGYEFKGNIQIGLNEYDIVLIGKKRKKFIPFENSNLDQLMQAKFTEITNQQKTLFEDMSCMWYINQKSLLPQEMIVNLNGPYHYIVGDKSGIVRSQAVKEEALRHYGLQNFCQIDYRQWEAISHDDKAITDFFQSVFKC